MQKFVGMGVALVTPFKKDLTVDFEALRKLVQFNIENGTDYLVINGTTGESATITKEEKQQILNTIVLPIARAGAIFHDNIKSGKFHGTICAITPIDS